MTYKNVALIPAYQPGPVLLDVIDQLKKANMEIILVDDGSGPQYSALFDEAFPDAHLLACTLNKGKGAALKTGMRYIKEKYGQSCVVVTVDADGQHRAEDALRLCHTARIHPDTLVLGSRKLKKKVPLKSQIGNTVTRLVYWLSTGIKIHDTQTGLRAFCGQLLPELLLVSGERYEYEMNVLLEFARRHIPIQETEIDTIYIDNNSASHFHVLKDSYRIYKEILKFSASSFIGFLVDYALYCLLFFLSANILLANIGARIVSALVNYSINCRFVFHSRSNIVKSAAQYFLLAAAVLFGNTLLLELLVHSFGINQIAAKLLTEILFFFVSWSVQHFIIFRIKWR